MTKTITTTMATKYGCYGNEGIEGFEWPKFKNEKQRIQIFSSLYKNVTIEKAFEEVYNQPITLSKETLSIINIIPQELNIGDVVDVILEVENGKIFIKCNSSKDDITCKNNLDKFESLKTSISKTAGEFVVKAKVIKKTKKTCTIDIFALMYDEWMEKINRDATYQYSLNEDCSTIAYNLQLTDGGYLCKVAVPSITKLVGEPYLVDAFIPGSQIVLNIESDFQKWVGKNVHVFVTNFVQKGQSTNFTAVCSRKKILNFIGQQNIINFFKAYTEDTDWWKTISNKPMMGVVTGIINSSKKCGVFIEIPEWNITGMISMSPSDVVKYGPKMNVEVKLVGFEMPMYYNDAVDQNQHVEPYTIEDGILKDCKLKPVLELA